MLKKLTYFDQKKKIDLSNQNKKINPSINTRNIDNYQILVITTNSTIRENKVNKEPNLTQVSETNHHMLDFYSCYKDI